MPVVPGALIATAALNVPAPPNADGFTVTCRFPGRLPEAGFNVSQLAPLLVVPVAEKLVSRLLLLERLTV
jgi:hypothetical protein